MSYFGEINTMVWVDRDGWTPTHTRDFNDMCDLLTSIKQFFRAFPMITYYSIYGIAST